MCSNETPFFSPRRSDQVIAICPFFHAVSQKWLTGWLLTQRVDRETITTYFRMATETEWRRQAVTTLRLHWRHFVLSLTLASIPSPLWTVITLFLLEIFHTLHTGLLSVTFKGSFLWHLTYDSSESFLYKIIFPYKFLFMKFFHVYKTNPVNATGRNKNERFQWNWVIFQNSGYMFHCTLFYLFSDISGKSCVNYI